MQVQPRDTGGRVKCRFNPETPEDGSNAGLTQRHWRTGQMQVQPRDTRGRVKCRFNPETLEDGSNVEDTFLHEGSLLISTQMLLLCLECSAVWHYTFISL
ncbi:hypothetical protein NQD34_013947 [Periophthalmus magnuspinnatus]|nr:hypothetical protein NQD34_013947 [Periophthalmus magnuspinnatus]